MPKAYWIARVDIADEANYPKYITQAKPAYERFGAKFIVRGGAVENLEGNNRARNVVIEFASMEDALACYNSAEYSQAKKIRQDCSVGDLIIVEGID